MKYFIIFCPFVLRIGLNFVFLSISWYTNSHKTVTGTCLSNIYGNLGNEVRDEQCLKEFTH